MVIDGLPCGAEPQPCCHFVVKEVAGLGSIVSGIVQLVNLQFVVFYQMMVWLSGEEQRGEVERVDNGVTTLELQVGEIFEVVTDDVVAADGVARLDEVLKFALGMCVQCGTVFA